MGRRGLAGGYTAIEIGVGGDHLRAVDERAKARGWSRAEWFRRASAALLRADLAAGLRARDEDEEGDEVDLDDAVDDLDDARSGRGDSGPILARGASAMGRGRWLGYYPADLADSEIVDDLRACVKGGTVFLRRSKNPDAHVVAYIDPPEEIEARNARGDGPSRFFREIAPGEDP